MNISVLMACYNAATHVRKSIDSVLDQSYKQFEFIIVNDGSEDDTLDIINSYSDPRIELIDLPANIGLVGALNIGLNACKGKYIARMDADDICLKDRLKIQKEFLDTNTDVVAVGSSVINYDKYGNEVEIKYPTEHSNILLHLIMYERTICHPTVMFRRGPVIGGGIKYEAEWLLCEDYHFWSQLTRIGQLANIGDPLVKYYRDSSQSSSKYRSLQVKNTAKLLRSILKKYELSKFDLVIDYLTLSKKLSKDQRKRASNIIKNSNSMQWAFKKSQIKEVVALKELRYCNKHASALQKANAVAKYLFCLKSNMLERFLFLWKIRKIGKMIT